MHVPRLPRQIPISNNKFPVPVSRCQWILASAHKTTMNLLLVHVIHVSIEIRGGTKASRALLVLATFCIVSLMLAVKHFISTASTSSSKVILAEARYWMKSFYRMIYRRI